MTKISSIGCCEFVKKLAIRKSIRNLSVWGCKGAEIAKITRKIHLKNHNLCVSEFETNFMTKISSIGCCELVTKIGEKKIDPEPFRSGIETGGNIAKYTKNTGKKNYL